MEINPFQDHATFTGPAPSDGDVDDTYQGMTQEEQEAEYARRLVDYEIKKREYEEFMANYDAMNAVEQAAEQGADEDEQKNIYLVTHANALHKLSKQSADYEASAGYCPPGYRGNLQNMPVQVNMDASFAEVTPSSMDRDMLDGDIPQEVISLIHSSYAVTPSEIGDEIIEPSVPHLEPSPSSVGDSAQTVTDDRAPQATGIKGTTYRVNTAGEINGASHEHHPRVNASEHGFISGESFGPRDMQSRESSPSPESHIQQMTTTMASHYVAESTSRMDIETINGADSSVTTSTFTPQDLEEVVETYHQTHNPNSMSPFVHGNTHKTTNFVVDPHRKPIHHQSTFIDHSTRNSTPEPATTTFSNVIPAASKLASTQIHPSCTTPTRTTYTNVHSPIHTTTDRYYEESFGSTPQHASAIIDMQPLPSPFAGSSATNQGYSLSVRPAQPTSATQSVPTTTMVTTPIAAPLTVHNGISGSPMAHAPSIHVNEPTYSAMTHSNHFEGHAQHSTTPIVHSTTPHYHSATTSPGPVPSMTTHRSEASHFMNHGSTITASGTIVSERRFAADSTAVSLYQPNPLTVRPPIASILGGDVHSTAYRRMPASRSAIVSQTVSVRPEESYIVAAVNGTIPHDSRVHAQHKDGHAQITATATATTSATGAHVASVPPSVRESHRSSVTHPHPNCSGAGAVAVRTGSASISQKNSKTSSLEEDECMPNSTTKKKQVGSIEDTAMPCPSKKRKRRMGCC